MEVKRTSEGRRAAILAEIAAIGPVLPGSVVERSTRCQRLGCHCRADPPQLHGPYATWLHQEGGRQVTTTLSADEARHVRSLVAADRRLRVLVAELESLSVAELADDRLNAFSSVGNSVRKAGKRAAQRY
jgi:hypothetical protein